MKIQALNNAQTTAGKNSKVVNFNGYNDNISKIMMLPIKNLKNAEDVFCRLITEVESDRTITKNVFFGAISNLFKSNGLRGMLENLSRTPHEDSYIECILEYVRKNYVVSLAKQENDIFDIVSYGGNSKDIRLGFLSEANKGGIEFYTDNKGDVFVERTSNAELLCRGFYSDTGSKKVEVKSYNGGTPEKTFFNRDGSKPFFKNLFFGW